MALPRRAAFNARLRSGERPQTLRRRLGDAPGPIVSAVHGGTAGRPRRWPVRSRSRHVPVRCVPVRVVSYGYGDPSAQALSHDYGVLPASPPTGRRRPLVAARCISLRAAGPPRALTQCVRAATRPARLSRGRAERRPLPADAFPPRPPYAVPASPDACTQTIRYVQRNCC